MPTWPEACLRTLAFFDVLNYPPTRVELLSQLWLEAPFPSPPEPLLLYEGEGAGDEVVPVRGRLTFPDRQDLVSIHEQNAGHFPRKLRIARRVARWLSHIDGVRFVAICNTTAFMNARDESDIDFFVIAKAGTIAQVRAWSTLPFKLLGRRPHAGPTDRDAVCLSFFIDDQALDLSPLMLKPSDPYFHFWFLNLLPLLDDGVGAELWNANRGIWSEHPNVKPWIIHSDLEQKKSWLRIPTPRLLDPTASRLQQKSFPDAIKSVMNKSTNVVVNDHVWKFHQDDGRENYRRRWQDRCRELKLEV